MNDDIYEETPKVGKKSSAEKWKLIKKEKERKEGKNKQIRKGGRKEDMKNDKDRHE